MKFDDAGNYLNFEYNNIHPQTASIGSKARYTASSNLNIYADSKGMFINAQDLGKWIESHSSLAIHSVPSQILDEQASTRATASTLMTYNGKIVKNGDRYYRIRAEIVDDPTVSYSSDEYEILNTNLTAFMQS